MPVHQIEYPLYLKPTGARHSRSLITGGRRTDVGVEAAGGGGEEVYGNRLVVFRVGGAQGGQPGVQCFSQIGVERPVVGPGGRG